MIKIWTDSNPSKIELPIPCSFDWSFSDLDKDSGRNDNGLLDRERVATKVKLSISWNPNVDKTKHYDMMSLLMNLPPFFYCSYPSPDGTVRNMECYRGDIKDSMYHYDANSGNIWKECSTSFIER